MARSRSTLWPVAIGIVAVLLAIVALPANQRQWAPSFLRSPELHYGLDLAGGTQLDFRISEEEIEQQMSDIETEIDQARMSGNDEQEAILQQQLTAIRDQRTNLTESIRTVLERRINALGVSEARITPSYVGDERHLLVDCPGVVNVQECIETVGKTIALEFKEEMTEVSPEFTQQVRDQVTSAQARITGSGQTLARVAEDFGGELGVLYQDERTFFQDTLPTGLESLWNVGPESGVRRIEGSLPAGTDENGQPREVPGIFLAEVTEPRTQTGRIINEAPVAFGILNEREENTNYVSHEEGALSEETPESVQTTLEAMQPGDLQVAEVSETDARLLFLRSFTPGRETMEASHILIAYSGALQAPAGVSRTKEEAEALANTIRTRLQNGEDFAALAAEFSEGPSGEQGGSLGTVGRGDLVPAFEDAAFGLETGAISEPVETQFGYHVIRSDRAPSTQDARYAYEELIVNGENGADRARTMLAQLQAGDVQEMEEVAHIRFLFFSLEPTGWKDTLLDGKHFRSATVTIDPTTGRPVIQINFDDEGAKLFAELTERNINKRIAIFVGGQLVTAPTVSTAITDGTAIITGSANIQEARDTATELNTGAIPAPIYLSGQRTIEATLGAQALQTSLEAALLGVLILMVYMIVVYRLLGILADVALAVYAVLFFALLKLPLFLFSSQYIVLTLAGMAGIILSIGMAVDANVLIFERMKEELRKGKTLKTAAKTGFERAWPSIRDGNGSTLITCAILFLIGSSIVRGFAITLATGVIISMLTAILITRWLVNRVADTPVAEKRKLFLWK